MTPDQMIERLLTPSSEDAGVISNNLFFAVHGGYPVENLRRLLGSAEGVEAFAFITSEGGVKARSLIQEVAALLKHDHPGVRYDGIDALTQCVTWLDDWAIASLVECLADDDAHVRHKSMRAIADLPDLELRAGLKLLKASKSDSIFASFENANLAIEFGKPQNLQDLIAHNDPVARRFGAALAMRRRLADTRYVAMVQMSGDTEVQTLATEPT